MVYKNHFPVAKNGPTTVPFRPGVQSLVTSDLELNTRYVLSRVTRPIEQRAKEITEIYRKYLLQ
jgi:hypothetical protein